MNDAQQIELLDRLESKLDRLIDSHIELRLDIEERNRLLKELANEIAERNQKIDDVGDALLGRDSEADWWKNGNGSEPPSLDFDE